jgi:hypothetical protein
MADKAYNVESFKGTISIPASDTVLTGTQTILVSARTVDISTAGQKPRLTITFTEGDTYTISIGQGTFTHTGYNYLFRVARKMALTLGSYAYTGINFTFKLTRGISITTGSYLVTLRDVFGTIGRRWTSFEKNNVSATNSAKNNVSVTNQEKWQ